jgi:hypothetical protein
VLELRVFCPQRDQRDLLEIFRLIISLLIIALMRVMVTCKGKGNNPKIAIWVGGKDIKVLTDISQQ